MARNQQPLTLRQQVKQLVTEGKQGEAYNLLKKSQWVPAGSGHQDFYPYGLALFAKVDWDKQILVSQGDRYWAWEVSWLKPDQYKFLYPTSKEYSFDGTCFQIIKELERRNWEVDGIQVVFQTYGTGAEKYRYVSYVKGDDFMIRFSRSQGQFKHSHYNDIAAVSTINIPRMELNVYSDNSGPTYYVYVGDDWEQDKEKFVYGFKVNSKLNNEPRTYLEYKGSWDGRHIYPGERAPYLRHNNDLGREYNPQPGEPESYSTSEVMETINNWLRDSVLKVILTTPIPAYPPRKGQVPDQPLLPANMSSFFCFTNNEGAERIETGHDNPADLQPASRYGLLGSPRLVPLDAVNDGSVPEVAYDGFLWCGLETVTPETPIDKLDIPGFYRWRDTDRWLVRVTPKSANGIYIADISAREKYKAGVFESNPEQEYLTGKQSGEYYRATGRTIIPISDYQGGFDQPVVLINREIGLDEVEIVKEIPHRR